MTTDYAVQAILHMDSGLPEDVVVNTWNIFTTASSDLTALDQALLAIVDYYLAVDSYLSSDLNGTLQLKAYDRSQPSPRVPVRDQTHALTVGTSAMPQEVALCMSFQADAESGLNQARRRGRIYLGPLATTVIGFEGRPLTAFVTAVKNAGNALLVASNASAAWSWSVWSETDGASSTIGNGWVDNAFDTQRRRGVRPTSRQIFT